MALFPSHGRVPVPWLCPHPTAVSPFHDFIPIPRLQPHPIAASPSHGCVPIPWLHPHPSAMSHPHSEPCVVHPLLAHGVGAPAAHPAPRPPHAGAQPLSLPAAEPGLECHPLQEHFGHVPRRFTSSPHLRHGAHHPAAAGPLRHQLFHFTQRGAHPQEELGEVLHPDILRWASRRGPGDRHPPRVRYRGPSPFPCPLFCPPPRQNLHRITSFTKTPTSGRPSRTPRSSGR